MSRQRYLLGFLLAVLLVAGSTGLGAVVPAGASTPASNTATVPGGPGTDTESWEGTTQPGANPTSECTLPTDDAFKDTHDVTLVVPAGLPNTITYTVKFEATWGDADQDLILTLLKGNLVVGSSDGSSAKETFIAQELPAGEYTVVVCPFTATDAVDYDGTVTVKAVAAKSVTLPQPADDRGLAFSAEVPADIQRDEGEPLIEIAPDGRTYTCGPTGFSQAAEYAQVSTDGGDQFHLIGEPPRGQFSLGGGGDCAMTTSPEKNADGDYQLSYTGLTGLGEFTSGTSPDGGKTFVTSPVSLVGPAVDRQWTVATSTDHVFMNFNRIAPGRNLRVCQSTTEGLVYDMGCETVSPSPLFPGPMRAIVDEADSSKSIVYYPWTQGTTVKLAVSMDDGATWNNCMIAETEGEPGIQFAVADHDEEGNLYVVYGDDADFNIYMSTLDFDKIADCQGGTTDQAAFRANPGWTDPVIVNREPIKTTVFPWIAAGGKPGRVGVSFYGTETEDRADTTDPKTWHVYVNQSLNALDADPDFSQVQATTHPHHYDQVCLLGLGCTTGGDRSLVDFFALEYNPVNGEYVVVFNEAHKQPGDTAGTVSTPVVFRQIDGPSNGGGTVDRDGRRVVRTQSVDPTKDALADYSSLGTPPQTSNVPGADITDVKVGPAIDPATGDPLPGGGFTVTMKIDDLSDAALADALSKSGAGGLPAPSLLYLFRFTDGYRYAAVQANYDPVRGFSFGHSDYTATVSECGSPEGNDAAAGDQCLQYPGETPIPGAVDQAKGTITITAPLALLQALEGPQGANQVPDEVPAGPGDRIYAAAAFTQSNPFTFDDGVQSFLYPLDNAPAMDFLIPRTRVPLGGNGNNNGDGDGNGGGGGSLPDDGGRDGDGDGLLPATGQTPLITLLGVLLLSLGGWVAMRRRRA